MLLLRRFVYACVQFRACFSSVYKFQSQHYFIAITVDSGTMRLEVIMANSTFTIILL